jgi:hypothetical protein
VRMAHPGPAIAPGRRDPPICRAIGTVKVDRAVPARFFDPFREVKHLSRTTDF